MPVVDDLQIKIQGDAVKANDAIDKLIGKLDRLSTSLNGLSGKNLSSLSSGVTRLSSAMATMNSVKTADFTRLATNITKLSTLDAGKISQAAGALHQFVNSLGSLNNVKISDTALHISELAKGIAQLGYKSSTQAVKNIPLLAQGMLDLMTTLSGAPKVSQNLIDMTNALAKLARTGSSSGKAATSLGRSLDTYTKSSKRAKIGTFSLASAIGKLYATYWMLFRAFGKIKEAINISSQLTEVQNVVDVTFGKYADLVDKMSEISINQFGMSELSVKKISSTFQAMGTAMGFAQGEMADMSIELTKLTADMASFYNVEQDAVAEDLASIFTGSTRPLRQYGLDLTYATLQEWALKQGMDANVKSMSQAEKTMLRYQYVLANTGAAQGDFLRTADTWANQTRILKQNFQQLGAVIGGTFINMLKPFVKALNNAMSHIIAFAKVVSNALGKIFGWTYEEGSGGIANDMEYAADSSDDLAGGLSDAEKNAKKLKSHLLGIDELNVFNPDEEAGGAGAGGSGSGGGGAGASGGQWKKTESLVEGFESELDTLYKLGEHIGNVLSEAMEGIEWEKSYEKARNWGKGLADFLNGLISPRLFENVGKTVAGSLNTALNFLNSFGKTFDWRDFGTSLSASLGGFFTTWDAGLTGETLSTFASGILEAMTGAIDELRENETFKTIGQKLVDFICGIDWLDVAWDLYGFFDSLSAALIEFPRDFGEGVLQSIADKIFGEGTVEIKLPDSLKEQVASSFVDFLPGYIENVKTQIDEIKEAFNFESWMASLNGMVEAFQVSWDTTKINAEASIQAFWDMVTPWFTLEKWLELYDTIRSSLETKWGEIKTWWSESALVLWWEEDVAPWFTIERWLELLTTIPETFKTKWSETKLNWIENLTTWWTEDVAPWFTKEKWLAVLNTIPSSMLTKWTETSNTWKTNIKTWWTQNVAPWFTKEKWSTMLESIPTTFKEAFKNAANFAIDMLNGVIEGIESLVNGAISALSSLVSVLNNIPGVNLNIDGWGVALPRIPRFEGGGHPDKASLFWANEHGIPELVGTIGNQPAVSSGAEITGIRDAVYTTGQEEASLLRTVVSLLEAISEKELSVSFSDREIAKASERGRADMGYALIV